jgi:hypothetical protein
MLIQEHRCIRYFGAELDPAAYRKGFGWAGRLAWGLNIVRAWLETRVARLVLRASLTKGGFTPEQVDALMADALVDPSFRPHPRQGPKRLFMPLVREKIAAQTTKRENFAEDRYAEGRKNAPTPLEHSPLAATFADGPGRRVDRAARYQHAGRRVMEIDDDDIVVKEEQVPRG